MSTKRMAKVAFISPNNIQNMIMKTEAFELGSQKSFRDFYFRAKEYLSLNQSFVLQLLSEGSPFDKVIYYNLTSLRDDAVAFNFFGDCK